VFAGSLKRASPAFVGEEMKTNSAKTISEQFVTEKHATGDESLVSRAIGGDLAAFDELCELHSPRLRRMIYQITRNREDAEDAVQDCLMQAFLHLTSFDGRAQFSTWLTRIAVNSALMLLRKRRNSAAISIDSYSEADDPFSTWEIADTTDDAERRLLKNEMEERLRRAIADLGQALRVPIELRIVQELSNKEGARQLNISTAAYKSRLLRAKAALRTAYQSSSQMFHVTGQLSKAG
jgi:RNA polymerase sigma-70 factor (ECF subfamily)